MKIANKGRIFLHLIMNQLIYIITYHIAITFLVTYTMDIQTKHLLTQLKLNSKFNSSDKYYCPFDNGKEQSRDHVFCCTCTQPQNKRPRINEGILNDKSDTLSPSDIVRKQYALLPYPAVTREEIDESRRHYKGTNSNFPYMIAPHNELDVVNHFLYKGRNKFMYEFFLEY